MSDKSEKLLIKHGLTLGDLLKLLSHLEGELQARDVAIAVLKLEKANQRSLGLKFEQSAVNDPVTALERDSATTDAKSPNLGQISIGGKMYESQLSQLENLITRQKAAAIRMKTMLAYTEKCHSEIVNELEADKTRGSSSVCHEGAQDETIHQLKQQLMLLTSENQTLQQELTHASKTLEFEILRQKQIVLYLLQQRCRIRQRLEEVNENTSVASHTEAEASPVQWDTLLDEIVLEDSGRQRLGPDGAEAEPSVLQNPAFIPLPIPIVLVSQHSVESDSCLSVDDNSGKSDDDYHTNVPHSLLPLITNMQHELASVRAELEITKRGLKSMTSANSTTYVTKHNSNVEPELSKCEDVHSVHHDSQEILTENSASVETVVGCAEICGDSVGNDDGSTNPRQCHSCSELNMDSSVTSYLTGAYMCKSDPVFFQGTSDFILPLTYRPGAISPNSDINADVTHEFDDVSECEFTEQVQEISFQFANQHELHVQTTLQNVSNQYASAKLDVFINRVGLEDNRTEPNENDDQILSDIQLASAPSVPKMTEIVNANFASCLRPTGLVHIKASTSRNPENLLYTSIESHNVAKSGTEISTSVKKVKTVNLSDRQIEIDEHMSFKDYDNLSMRDLRQVLNSLATHSRAAAERESCRMRRKLLTTARSSSISAGKAEVKSSDVRNASPSSPKKYTSDTLSTGEQTETSVPRTTVFSLKTSHHIPKSAVPETSKLKPTGPTILSIPTSGSPLPVEYLQPDVVSTTVSLSPPTNIPHGPVKPKTLDNLSHDSHAIGNVDTKSGNKIKKPNRIRSSKIDPDSQCERSNHHVRFKTEDQIFQKQQSPNQPIFQMCLPTQTGTTGTKIVEKTFENHYETALQKQPIQAIKQRTATKLSQEGMLPSSLLTFTETKKLNRRCRSTSPEPIATPVEFLRRSSIDPGFLEDRLLPDHESWMKFKSRFSTNYWLGTSPSRVLNFITRKFALISPSKSAPISLAIDSSGTSMSLLGRNLRRRASIETTGGNSIHRAVTASTDSPHEYKGTKLKRTKSAKETKSKSVGNANETRDAKVDTAKLTAVVSSVASSSNPERRRASAEPLNHNSESNQALASKIGRIDRSNTSRRVSSAESLDSSDQYDSGSHESRKRTGSSIRRTRSHRESNKKPAVVKREAQINRVENDMLVEANQNTAPQVVSHSFENIDMLEDIGKSARSIPRNSSTTRAKSADKDKLDTSTTNSRGGECENGNNLNSSKSGLERKGSSKSKDSNSRQRSKLSSMDPPSTWAADLLKHKKKLAIPLFGELDSAPKKKASHSKTKDGSPKPPDNAPDTSNNSSKNKNGHDKNNDKESSGNDCKKNSKESKLELDSEKPKKRGERSRKVNNASTSGGIVASVIGSGLAVALSPHMAETEEKLTANQPVSDAVLEQMKYHQQQIVQFQQHGNQEVLDHHHHHQQQQQQQQQHPSAETMVATMQTYPGNISTANTVSEQPMPTMFPADVSPTSAIDLLASAAVAPSALQVLTGYSGAVNGAVVQPLMVAGDTMLSNQQVSVVDLASFTMNPTTCQPQHIDSESHISNVSHNEMSAGLRSYEPALQRKATVVHRHHDKLVSSAMLRGELDPHERSEISTGNELSADIIPRNGAN